MLCIFVEIYLGFRGVSSLSNGVNESTMVNLYLVSQFRRHSAVLRAHTAVSHTRRREAARADAQVSTAETSLNSYLLRLTD